MLGSSPVEKNKANVNISHSLAQNIMYNTIITK